MTDRRRRIVIGVAVLVAVQAVIILLYRSGDSGRRKPAAPRFPGERVSAALDAQALVLERQDGTSWKVDALRGRPVVLHFWATWCRPCRDELPTLLAQRERIRRAGGELALVSVDDDWAEIRGFFGGAVPDEVSRAIDGDYRTITTGVLPETLIVDAAGGLAGRVRGPRDWRSTSAATFLDSLE
ncbi:MAG: TlpA disulfide reductase family protein [Kofleriaceae bacterium]